MSLSVMPMESLQSKFSIRMRQEPQGCGIDERGRRVIYPPPILEMYVDAPNALPKELERLEAVLAFVHCTLRNPSGDSDAAAMAGMADKRQECKLTGTLVANAFVGNDDDGVKGRFFCFPDLSLNVPATYSLRFSLVILDPFKMQPGYSTPVQSTISSKAFTVPQFGDLERIRASTKLTTSLKGQGGITLLADMGKAKSFGEDEINETDEFDGDDLKEVQMRKRVRGVSNCDSRL